MWEYGSLVDSVRLSTATSDRVLFCGIEQGSNGKRYDGNRSGDLYSSVTLPPYAVILHNYDHNEMDFVVSALLKSVSSLSREDALRIMLEAHNTGQALVIVCPLEHAELYRDRLRSFTLGVTIEKA